MDVARRMNMVTLIAPDAAMATVLLIFHSSIHNPAKKRQRETRRSMGRLATRIGIPHEFSNCTRRIRRTKEGAIRSGSVEAVDDLRCSRSHCRHSIPTRTAVRLRIRLRYQQTLTWTA
jgi:hypothetical protein